MVPLNIMIVDDSSVVVRILNSTLTQLGHKVVATAHSGAEALIAYNVCNPDVVFMDVTMPDMDGITATEKIVKDHPGASIIIVTSQTDKNVVINARKAGAKGYILKPFQADKLRNALDAMMTAKLNEASSK